jgi:hypothetical protein
MDDENHAGARFPTDSHCSGAGPTTIALEPFARDGCDDGDDRDDRDDLRACAVVTERWP